MAFISIYPRGSVHPKIGHSVWGRVWRLYIERDRQTDR